jgi:hypothetical protein
MNLQRAVVIAVQMIRKEIQALAFDANLFDRCGVDNPVSRRASKRRKELRDAIALLVEKGREG